MTFSSENIFDEERRNPRDARYVLQVAVFASLPEASGVPEGYLAVVQDSRVLYQAVSGAWVSRGVLPGSGGGGPSEPQTTITLDAGTLGSLPLHFDGDADTGLFLEGANQPALVAGGEVYLRFVPGQGVELPEPLLATTFAGKITGEAGLEVAGNVLFTGDLTVSGTLTATVAQAGALTGVSTAGNSKYYGTDGSGNPGFHTVPGVSGTVTNPLGEDLEGAGHKLTDAAFQGFYDAFYDLDDDPDSMIDDDTATLTSDYNAYFFQDLGLELVLKLPSVSNPVVAPFGVVSVKLDTGGSLSLASSPAWSWAKAHPDDPAPVIPSAAGSAFALRYRYDPAASIYVVTLETFGVGTPSTPGDPGDATIVTYSYTAAASQDDGSAQVAGTVTTGGISVYVGTDAVATRSSFLRIPNVTIPQGAVITEARVNFITYRDYPEATWVWRWYARDVDDGDGSGYPPADRAAFDAYVRTTAYVTETATGPLGYRVPWESADFAPVIQEIVDRSGWSSGNSIVLLMDFVSQSEPELDIEFRSADTSQQWTITIKYEEPE